MKTTWKESISELGKLISDIKGLIIELNIKRLLAFLLSIALVLSDVTHHVKHFGFLSSHNMCN